MKRFFTTLILMFFGLFSMAQDIENNKQIMNRIIMDEDAYLYSIAIADTFDLAVKEAVGMLANQIVTNVKSVSTSSVSSEVGNDTFSETSYFSSIVQTFTDVRLSEYHVLMVDKPGKKNKSYAAFVYISSDKVREIIDEMKRAEEEAAIERFEKLKKDVNFYFDEGMRALDDIRIGDALKYFYWGYVMSINTKANIDRNNVSQPAAPVFSALLDQTLDAIKVVCEKETEEQVNEYQTYYVKQLAFYYKQKGTYKKITCLDFKYYNGNTFVTGPRVRDGIGMAELSYDLSEIKVHCTYNYEESETPPHILEIMRSKQVKLFSSADKTVNLKVPASIEVPMVEEKDVAIATGSEEETTNSAIALDSTRAQTLYDIMMQVERAIRNKKHNEVAPYFTDNGWDCFNKLVRYGNASIIGVPEYEFVPFGNIVICRSIPMQFRFKNNKQFIEKVTLRFNEEDLIDSIAFTLSEVAEHDILDNTDWKMSSKLTLLTFMEDYQTAYALKRIDYLEKIFSENALIISGYKVLKKAQSDGYKLNGYTHYDTLSKSQYLNRLRGFFSRKEYINLNFTDTEFTQAWNTEDFFGVRVRQEYFSNTYGDVGYLFLLVDLREKVPTIHIRAWQDDKLPLDYLFSLKDVY